MSPSDKVPVAKSLPTLCVLAFAVVASTQGFKQIIEGDSILKKAKRGGRYVYTVVDDPVRGTILSSDGEILAQNQKAATLGIRFDRVPNAPGFFLAVSEATGIPASELAVLAADDKVRSREWRRTLTAEQIRRLEQAKLEWRADGVSIHRNGVRNYPLGSSTSSFLGIVDEANGSFGLEKSLNIQLKGIEGETIGMVDRDGSFLPMRLANESKRRVDGQDVVLTIDSGIQIEATRAVRSAVEEFKAESGVAVVMDPKTGDVLALANWPSFDPDDPAAGAQSGPVSVGVNPAYMMAWEPGSTFKTLTLALAIDEGKATMGDRIQCRGTLRAWSDKEIGCDEHNGVRAHGSVDPVLAIAKSCNVSAALWAKAVGHRRFVEFIDQVGLTQPTGIPVTGEANGSFVRDEYAKELQLATFGFGQSLTVTPMGMVDAFALLANKGVRMKPRLLKSIKGVEQPIVSLGQVFKADTCRQVLQCMRATIETDSGTGRRLRIAGYEMGGKTGTAQKIGKATVGRRAYVSNFVGFVPALDPQAVILVMVNDPKTKYYGSEVAGPVFLQIAKKTIERMGIPPTQSKPQQSIGSSSRRSPAQESNQRIIDSPPQRKPKKDRNGPTIEVDTKRVRSPQPSIHVESKPATQAGGA